MNSVVSSYKNGNYLVLLYSDGTKKYRMINPKDQEFISDFPDSIDIKITNKCLNNCSFCHEGSDKYGKHSDVDEIFEKALGSLPKVGIELAIGGGNPIEHPDFKRFLIQARINGFVCRVTLRDKDFIDKIEKIIELKKEGLLGAIGISVENIQSVEKLRYLLSEYYKSNSDSWGQFIVLHTIIGITPIEDFLKFPLYFKKILVLGFKQWGRAINSKIDPKVIEMWKTIIRRLRYDRISENTESSYCFPGLILGFDNLAIEQLELKNSMIKDEWEQIYMGDEFSHSMYIDAVKGEYAETSRSPERVSWDDVNIIDYFKKKS